MTRLKVYVAELQLIATQALLSHGAIISASCVTVASSAGEDEDESMTVSGLCCDACLLACGGCC